MGIVRSGNRSGHRRGRPRKQNRVPQLLVGTYTDESLVDVMDEICAAMGKSRSQALRELIADFIEENQHLAGPSQDQEPLIAS